MELESILKKYFGFDKFLPGQKEIIEHIIKGENVIAVMPTGGGKSLCFQLPALISNKYSIVVSPLIALMKDQIDSLQKKNIPTAYISSNLSYSERNLILHKTINNEIKILYVSPERLDSDNFLQIIANYPPEYLFVDEAHCISEWGQSFRPSYRKIKNFIERANISKVSAFTATATKKIIEDIASELKLKNPRVFVKGFARENISIEGRFEVDKNKQLLSLVTLYDNSTLVYCSSRKQTEEVAALLNSYGIKANYYHAGLPSEIRNQVQESFFENKIKVLAATSAFGMGIDKQDIRTIIHYELPSSLESYYQEIGRAGRDGNSSKAIFFLNKKDINKKRYLINLNSITKQDIYLIYDSIFNYSSVAYGIKPNFPLPIDYDYLKKVFPNHKDIILTANIALNVLEISGILKRTFKETQTSLKILVSPESLKNYVKFINDYEQKAVLFYLLSSYGASIFEDFIQISLSEISQTLEIEIKQLVAILHKLSHYGIISYKSENIGERAIFNFERTDPKLLNINFDKIEFFNDNLKFKLNKVVEFAYVKKCRMKFLIEYFGESSQDYKCGICDNCLNINQDIKAIEEYFVESVLLAYYHSLEKIDKKELINILKGISENITDKNNPAFGRFSLFSTTDIQNKLNEMQSRGIIKTDKYGFIEISNSIQDNPKNKNATEFNSDTELKSKFENESYKLKNEILALRKQIALKFNQPENLILSDETIERILSIKPASKEEFLLIKGTSENIYNKIGKKIIDIIKIKYPAKYKLSNDFEENISKNLDKDLRIIRSLVYKGETFISIAEKLNIDSSLLSLKIETIANLDKNMPLEKLIEKEKILKALDLIEKIKIKDTKTLKEIYGDDLSYSEARLILLISRLRNNVS